MTQFIIAINGTLIFLLGALPQTNLEDNLKTIISLIIGAALAFLGPFLPKVSETIREALSLRTYNRK